MWQAARVAERRTAYQLDTPDRLAGGAATSRDVPGEPQPGPAGPPPDPYWITAEALRQRHLRERRLLVAARPWWRSCGSGRPRAAPSGGPGPDLPAAPGAPAGVPPTLPTPRPLAAPASAAPWGAPAAPAPARRPRGSGARTDAALEYWMRREGWRRASPVALRAFLAAGSAGWCVLRAPGAGAAPLRSGGPGTRPVPGQPLGAFAGWWASCSRGRPSRAAGQVAPPAPAPAPPALPDQEAGYG